MLTRLSIDGAGVECAWIAVIADRFHPTLKVDTASFITFSYGTTGARAFLVLDARRTAVCYVLVVASAPARTARVTEIDRAGVAIVTVRWYLNALSGDWATNVRPACTSQITVFILHARILHIATVVDLLMHATNIGIALVVRALVTIIARVVGRVADAVLSLNHTGIDGADISVIAVCLLATG